MNEYKLGCGFIEGRNKNFLSIEDDKSLTYSSPVMEALQ
jgi:hypothetical protein